MQVVVGAAEKAAIGAIGPLGSKPGSVFGFNEDGSSQLLRRVVLVASPVHDVQNLP